MEGRRRAFRAARHFRRAARRFAREEVAPVAGGYDRRAEFPRALIEKAWELGLLNTVIGEPYGGLGLGSVDACLVAEEIAWGCGGIATSVVANDLALLGNLHETRLHQSIDLRLQATESSRQRGRKHVHGSFRKIHRGASFTRFTV